MAYASCPGRREKGKAREEVEVGRGCMLEGQDSVGRGKTWWVRETGYIGMQAGVACWKTRGRKRARQVRECEEGRGGKG